MLIGITYYYCIIECNNIIYDTGIGIPGRNLSYNYYS